MRDLMRNTVVPAMALCLVLACDARAAAAKRGPFFQAWGVPTSARARQSVAKLPPWMPENFPPK